MISGTDIRDWGSGVPEGQKATNGIGWEIQHFVGSHFGWVAVGSVYPTKEIAERNMEVWQEIFPTEQYRVYEALEFPVKEKK